MKGKGKFKGKPGREKIVLTVWWGQPRFEY